MIPIGDENPRRSFPVATLGLVILNVVVFLYQLTLSPAATNVFVANAALIPSRLLQERNLAAATTLVTAMFIHGGWSHLIGNMIFLWVFGDNVEDRLGVLPFLVIYLLTGIAASATQIAIDPTSSIPIVGASGALAGIAGVYLVLFPRARVRVVIPLFFFFRVVLISAPLFLLIWFATQLLQGLMSVGSAGTGGVAWFAHVGGFVSGALVGLLVRSGAGRSNRHNYDAGLPSRW